MKPLIAAALVVLLQGPAVAEPAYMEAQRCIWRCLHNSPGDRAYQACVAQRCNDSPRASARRQPAAPPSPAADPTGSWTFGDHPDLGRAAFVSVGDEAFGIACNDAAHYPGSHSISIRMTPGLAAIRSGENHLAWVVDEPFAIGGLAAAEFNVRGFFESRSNFCETPFDRLRRSKSIVFLKNSGATLLSEGSRTVLKIEQADGSVDIRTSADLQKVAEKRVAPLAGSTAALSRLIQACPALRRQVNDDCTGGH